MSHPFVVLVLKVGKTWLPCRFFLAIEDAIRKIFKFKNDLPESSNEMFVQELMDHTMCSSYGLTIILFI